MSTDSIDVTTTPSSNGANPPRSFMTTWLFALLLGWLGVDRFYLGKIGTGVLKLLTFGGYGIWIIIDLILLLTGGTRDKQGRQLLDEPQSKKTQWIVSGAVVALVLIIGSINAGNSGSSNPVAEEVSITEPVKTKTPSATPTPTVTPTQSATPVAPAAPVEDSASNIAAFVSGGHGDIADMNKDLDDMVMRASNSQNIRLMGNALELSFNVGQLQSLTPPSAIAGSWAPQLAALEAAVTQVTDDASSYAAGLISLDAMLGSIEATRAQAAALDAIVSQVG